MELRDFLELGTQKAGSLTALGKILDVSQPNMSHSKSHKKPLSTYAVIRLADYIGADLRAVIAANELVTEKKEEKRRFWSPFVEHARPIALLIAVAGAANFATPPPAEASVFKASQPDSLYYVKCRMKKASKKGQLFRTLKRFVKPLLAHLASRTLQPEPV